MKRWIPAVDVTKQAAKYAARRGDTQPMFGAQLVVEEFFLELARRVRGGEKVMVPGFGVFRLATRKARVLRNFDGQMLKVPAVEAIAFRAVKSQRVSR